MTPQERYKEKNIVQVKIEVNRKTEADILARLQMVGNKAGYIKHLIRQDIKKGS